MALRARRDHRRAVTLAGGRGARTLRGAARARPGADRPRRPRAPARGARDRRALRRDRPRRPRPRRARQDRREARAARRSPASTALTAAQLRVARLAADGLDNREIAETAVPDREDRRGPPRRGLQEARHQLTFPARRSPRAARRRPGTGECWTIFSAREPRKTRAIGPIELEPTTSTSPSAHGTSAIASAHVSPWPTTTRCKPSPRRARSSSHCDTIAALRRTHARGDRRPRRHRERRDPQLGTRRARPRAARCHELLARGAERGRHPPHRAASPHGTPRAPARPARRVCSSRLLSTRPSAPADERPARHSRSATSSRPAASDRACTTSRHRGATTRACSSAPSPCQVRLVLGVDPRRPRRPRRRHHRAHADVLAGRAGQHRPPGPAPPARPSGAPPTTTSCFVLPQHRVTDAVGEVPGQRDRGPDEEHRDRDGRRSLMIQTQPAIDRIGATG